MKFEVVIENNSLSFQRFAAKVSELINNDEELIERTNQTQFDFVQKVDAILQDPQKRLFAGRLISDLQSKTPRYTWIKNLEYNGTKYIAEIDHLEYKVFLQKM